MFVQDGCPTACVTCVWAGVDSVWGKENAEARKMLLNRADSHMSGTRFVGRLCARHADWKPNPHHQHPKLDRQLTRLLHELYSFARTKTHTPNFYKNNLTQEPNWNLPKPLPKKPCLFWKPDLTKQGFISTKPRPWRKPWKNQSRNAAEEKNLCKNDLTKRFAK